MRVTLLTFLPHKILLVRGGCGTQTSGTDGLEDKINRSLQNAYNERGFFYIGGQSTTFIVAPAIILLNALVITLGMMDQTLIFSPANPMPVLVLGAIEAMLIAPFVSRMIKSMREVRAAPNRRIKYDGHAGFSACPFFCVRSSRI